MSGGLSASSGAVFRTNGVVPVDVILCPSHSYSRCANLHFYSFNDIFSLSNFFSNFSLVEMCSISDPLVVIKTSSIKICARGSSDNMEFITLSNSAVLDVKPQNPVFKRYVSVDLPSTKEKLH